MKKIQVLLVGTGGYGARYLGEFLSEKNEGADFELAAVADPFAANSPRFEDLKKRSIPIYQSPADFYAEKRADLAVIASPIHTHYPYILCCFKNGTPVLCEKPLAGDMAQLEELAAKGKETGLFVAVGFQLCFSRDVLELKKDILSGLFGKPVELKAMRINCRTTKYYRRNGWAGRLSFDGQPILDSPLQNANAHELQNMLFLLGDKMGSCVPVESVRAETWRCRPDIENFDAAALRVTTPGGVKLHYYTAHCVEENMREPLGEYRFEKAVVSWGNPAGSRYTAHFNDGRVKSYKELASPDMQKLHDALEALRSGAPLPCTLETVRSHSRCVQLVQEFPIRTISPEQTVQGTTAEGDSFYYSPGLAEALHEAYDKNALPSEIGFTR